MKTTLAALLGALLCLVLTGTGSSSASGPTASGGLRVRIGPHLVVDSVMAIPLLPGERVGVSVETDVPSRLDRTNATASGGTLSKQRPGAWSFTAPDAPGLVQIEITQTAPLGQGRRPSSIRLQVFVLTPWDHEGTRLGGYRMGTYRKKAFRGLKRYERPAGFIRVTEANREEKVSPHFRLEQFLCKQTTTMPQYVLVRPRLLATLEQVLADVVARGHDVSTLHVMSGYRTPYYNRRIGNTTGYSRHLYGDGVDIFVDADGNGWMDDLNGDGVVTKADAQVLASWVQAAAQRDGTPFVGGLGVYGPKPPHRGPFVHVDLRGFDARW